MYENLFSFVLLRIITFLISQRIFSVVCIWEILSAQCVILRRKPLLDMLVIGEGDTEYDGEEPMVG